MRISPNYKYLAKIDQEFLHYLNAQNLSLFKILTEARAKNNLCKQSYSKLICEMAGIVEEFIRDHFKINIDAPDANLEFDQIYQARRKFVERYCQPLKAEAVTFEQYNFAKEQLKHIVELDNINKLAKFIIRALDDNAPILAALKFYCIYKVQQNSAESLFNIPRKLDGNLRAHKIEQLKSNPYLGFNHRPNNNSSESANMHIRYCLYCHQNNKDSCSVGLNSQKSGCPLDQKISEMNYLAKKGYYIGALATIIIDNPMVAMTGHRICNDCAKACIFQKQEHVDVPAIESHILEQVLNLEYGPEIYYLLTLWNPLKLTSYLPAKEKKGNILVAGLGPAGFTLSYYLAKEGHKVVAIDGLKIQLPNSTEPIKNWRFFKQDLAKRIPSGFGGVAEYGITSRWDKNFLDLIHIFLLRSSNITILGGIKLGNNITTQDAFSAGFDHVALCIGAGSPRFIAKDQFFASGVKTATDFLMQLQQNAAYQNSSNSNLQVRLPAIVYGLGLTAVDAATELLNYYPEFVKNFALSYKIKHPELDYELANEYLHHANLFSQAKNDKERTDIIKKIGGVKILYRGKIRDSSAFNQNMEEIEFAQAAGIEFVEDAEISEVISDEGGRIQMINLHDGRNFSAKTLLISLGVASTNFADHRQYFDENSSELGIFFKRLDHKISHFGDCNPNYHGTVVKAIASVKNGYQEISNNTPYKGEIEIDFFNNIRSKLVDVSRIIGDQFTLQVNSPYAASKYKIGQFFKLQNITNILEDQMEALALSPCKVDKNNGDIFFKIKIVGKTTKVASALQTSSEITLAGPLGKPVAILNDQRYLIIASKFYEDLATLFVNQIRNHQSIAELKIIEEYNETIDQYIHDFVPNEIHILGDERLLSTTQDQYSHNAPIFCNLNIPMQCMMGGICGQCIYKDKDSNNFIFACTNSRTNLQKLNLKLASQRLRMNQFIEQIQKS